MEPSYTATFRFYGDLLPLLSPVQRAGYFLYPFKGRQSAKHLVEAASVPHTEVGALFIDGQPAGLEAIVRGGQQVDVLPCQPPVSAEPDPRFILDNHLGRLAASLRMLGFDCLYRNDYQDEELAAVAEAQARILLTRDRRLLMRKQVQRGRLLRSLDSRQQLAEILQRYTLKPAARPFLRCIHCNDLLTPVAKAEIDHLLEPLTRQYFDEFRRCIGCGRIYWKGSHYEKMVQVIEGL